MNMKVVIIDDNPFVREAIAKTMNWDELGCVVVGTAADGLEGKQIVMNEKPDIIITDIKMPGLNGLELTEIIKSKLPYAKIIAITGYQDFEYAQKAIKLGMFDFILKPIKNEELSQVVKSAADTIKKELNMKNSW
jgi:two-component system response regulator YesN